LGLGNIYTYNQDNQRQGSGNSYDANGNVSAEASGPSFAYNSRNQTSSVTPAGGSATVFGWLGAGQNELMSDGSTALHYGRLGLQWHYDGANTDYYTRTPDGRLAGIIKNTGGTPSSRYPLFDQLGSVTAQTDSSGAVARSYTYTPYGVQAATGGSAWDDTIGYAGGAQTTSAGLIHFGQRLYDPNTSRWTQMDPRGPLSQDYEYAGDDPINAVDPSGRDVIETIVTGVGAAVTCATAEVVATAGLCIGEAGRFGYDVGIDISPKIKPSPGRIRTPALRTPGYTRSGGHCSESSIEAGTCYGNQ
jgi:RHS repeat-associated protein